MILVNGIIDPKKDKSKKTLTRGGGNISEEEMKLTF